LRDAAFSASASGTSPASIFAPLPKPTPGAAVAGSVTSIASAAAVARLAYRTAVEKRMAKVAPGDVAAAFPFGLFFATAPGGIDGIFKRQSAMYELYLLYHGGENAY
jgi:hypothetical protein